MLKEPITVIAHTTVGGPDGEKLLAGKVYELQDSPYVRVLIQSKTVSLVDPPSLDPKFLEKAGYELCEGYSYDEEIVEEEPAVNNPEEPVVNTPEEPTSQEKGSDHEPKNLQLTPPIGMGVTTSVEKNK